MIHVVTVHYESLKWLPVQYRHIKKNMEDFKLWTFLDGVNFLPWRFGFDVHFKAPSNVELAPALPGAYRGSENHACKLDKMVYKHLAEEPDDDIVLFLDGDSFPIAPIDSIIHDALSDHDFFAIVREENGDVENGMGDYFPHPSFACCKLGFWRHHKLTWRVDTKERSTRAMRDTGTRLYWYFKENPEIKWKKMRRSRGLRRWHPVLFGIYDELVYHHGAAFRRTRTRWDCFEERRCKEFGKKYREEESKLVPEARRDFASNFLFRKMRGEPDFFSKVLAERDKSQT